MLMESQMKSPQPIANILTPTPEAQPPLVPASFISGRAWFVAVCSPFEMHWTTGKDGKGYFPVEQRINEAGFETFVPIEMRWTKQNGRKRKLVEPVLHQYILVRFDRERDEWGQLRHDHIKGVWDILKNQDVPVRVDDVKIDRLRNWESAGVFDYTKPLSAFNKGDNVEIKEGPFAGLMAKVRSVSPKKRIKVLLAGLGSLEIGPEYLAKVRQ